MDIKKLPQKDLDYIKSVYNNKDLTWDERIKELMIFLVNLKEL